MTSGENWGDSRMKAAVVGLSLVLGVKRTGHLTGIPFNTIYNWKHARAGIAPTAVLANAVRKAVKDAMRENGWEVHGDEMRGPSMPEAGTPVWPD